MPMQTLQRPQIGSVRACACIRPGRVRRSAPLRPICSTAPAAAPAPDTDKAASSSGSGSGGGAVEKEQQQHAWDVAGAVVRPAFRARPWDYQEEGQQQQQGGVPSGKAAAAGTTALPRTKVRSIIRALRVGGVIAFCSAAQRAPLLARVRGRLHGCSMRVWHGPMGPNGTSREARAWQHAMRVRMHSNMEVHSV